MPKDADLEDAPVAPEMGTIELKVYRCQKRGPTGQSRWFAHEDPHWGRISELSKKAGWHHVAYVTSVESSFLWSLLMLLLLALEMRYLSRSVAPRLMWIILTHPLVHRMRPSRYFIALEVNSLFFPEFLTHISSRAIESTTHNPNERCGQAGISNQEQEACQGGWIGWSIQKPSKDRGQE